MGVNALLKGWTYFYLCSACDYCLYVCVCMYILLLLFWFLTPSVLDVLPTCSGVSEMCVRIVFRDQRHICMCQWGEGVNGIFIII